MVKEFEVVDGFPILDEYQHINMERGGEEMSTKIEPYKIYFRLPLKGISPYLISTTQLNICNMFTTLYFMQLVVILKSDSIIIPNKKIRKSDNGYQTIES